MRTVSLVLEELFQITLADLRNSFHRMKYRTGSRDRQEGNIADTL